MGGAIGKGNVSPAAEFNIYFDPHAFKQVLDLKGEIKLTMIPLEVTYKIQTNDEVMERLEKGKNTLFLLSIKKML